MARRGVGAGFGVPVHERRRSPAQRAVRFVQQSQNPYLAWRYGVRDGDNDTSVTGWAVLVLHTAQRVGLEVDPGAFRGGLAWIDKMTEPEFGRTGYQQRGGRSQRPKDYGDRFPVNVVEPLTGLGVFARVASGSTPENDEMIGKGLVLLDAARPRWDASGSVDSYYWFWGSLAMHNVASHPGRADWLRAVREALVSAQAADKTRCDRGSWNPEADAWGPAGRVYLTAISCLTLEAPIRSAPLVAPAPRRKR